MLTSEASRLAMITDVLHNPLICISELANCLSKHAMLRVHATRLISTSQSEWDSETKEKRWKETEVDGVRKGKCNTYERLRVLVSCTLVYERADTFKVEGMQKNFTLQTVGTCDDKQ